MRKPTLQQIFFLIGMALIDPCFGQPNNCAVGVSKGMLDINNVRAVVANAGDMWHDFPGNPGYQVLENGAYTAHSIFAGGLWFGGVGLDSQLYLAAQTYRQGIISYWPGPIDPINIQTSQPYCYAFDQHFKVNRNTINEFRYKFQNNQVNNMGDVHYDILHWPGKGNPYLPIIDLRFDGLSILFDLAPFVDVDSNDTYDPLAGDYPLIKGDQAVWWVMNDVGNGKQIGNVPSAALGLEVQVMAYAWNNGGDLSNSSFYDYKLINRGSQTTLSSYVGIFTDIDLGNYQDDYIGCEVKRGIAYSYHEENSDPQLGKYPPTLGLSFSKGIIADLNDGEDNNHNGFVDETDEDIRMSGFVYYNYTGGSSINGYPIAPTDYYNYLRGRWKNGQRLTFDFGNATTPINGTSPITNSPPVGYTNFMYPGRSDTAFGISMGGGVLPQGTPLPNQYIWDEIVSGNPTGDRRTVMSMGPFTFVSGETKEFTLSVIYSRTYKENHYDKLDDLFETFDDLSCVAANSCATLAEFHGPNTTHTISSNNINLTLEADTFLIDTGGVIAQMHTENYKQFILGASYKFQGYQVFQLRNDKIKYEDLDDTTKCRMVAQSDLADSVTSLYNLILGPQQGQFTNKLMVQGNNTGIEWNISLTIDAFTQQPLNLGTPKYYAVVAYAAAEPVFATQYLRSNKNFKIIKVEPQQIVLNSVIPSISVKKLSGQGSGLTPLALKTASSDSLLKYPSGYAPTYQASAGPVSVLVTDLSVLTNAEYKLEINSYLEFSNATGNLSVGDTIVSLGIYTYSPPSTNPPYLVLSRLPQVAGEAIVERIIDSVNGKIEIRLIGDINGRFTALMEFTPSNNGYHEDSIVPQPFQIKNSATTALANYFAPGELWRLTDISNNVVYRSDIPMSRELLQVIPQLGISILSSSNTINRPIKRNSFDYLHRHTRSYGLGDLVPVSEDLLLHYKMYLGSQFPEEFNNLVSKSGWQPYACSNVISFGVSPVLDTANGKIKYPFTSNSDQNYLLNFEGNNIMVVLTNDSSQWSRSPVLQLRRKGATNLVRACLLKSYLPSVDKTFTSDTLSILSPFYAGSPSRGMSWFPGYAIDLDKGERVHLMFSEDRLKTNGENLIWEPTADAYGGNSYIFITNLPYDQDLERALDSLVPNTPTGLPVQNSLANFYARTITWVGAFKSTVNGPLGLADTLYISADKPYRHLDGKLPTYTFGTAEVLLSSQDATYKGNRAVAFPNPASTELRFKIMDENTRADRVLLYNLLGTRVAEKVFLNEQDQSVGLGGLASGTYIYILLDRTGRQFPGKFVKE